MQGNHRQMLKKQNTALVTSEGVLSLNSITINIDCGGPSSVTILLHQHYTIAVRSDIV